MGRLIRFAAYFGFDYDHDRTGASTDSFAMQLLGFVLPLALAASYLTVASPLWRNDTCQRTNVAILWVNLFTT